MKRRSIYLLAILALLVVPVLAACGGGGGSSDSGGGSSATPAQDVTMADFKFGPDTLTAKVNEPLKLNLINDDAIVHDFAVEAIDYDSGEIGAGDSKVIEVVFQEAGEYDFICTVPGHAASGMTGTITVTE